MLGGCECCGCTVLRACAGVCVAVGERVRVRACVRVCVCALLWHRGDRDFLPDSVKERMYYLFSVKGWDVCRLGEHFGLQTDRVSAIINLKATEKPMIDSGRCVQGPVMEWEWEWEWEWGWGFGAVGVWGRVAGDWEAPVLGARRAPRCPSLAAPPPLP